MELDVPQTTFAHVNLPHGYRLQPPPSFLIPIPSTLKRKRSSLCYRRVTSGRERRAPTAIGTPRPTGHWPPFRLGCRTQTQGASERSEARAARSMDGGARNARLVACKGTRARVWRDGERNCIGRILMSGRSGGYENHPHVGGSRVFFGVRGVILRFSPSPARRAYLARAPGENERRTCCR
jgi:hypothetical protein